MEEQDTGVRVGGERIKLVAKDESEAVGKLQRFKNFIVGKSVEDAVKVGSLEGRGG